MDNVVLPQSLVAEEKKLSQENEKRLRRDATTKLAGEQGSRGSGNACSPSGAGCRGGGEEMGR